MYIEIAKSDYETAYKMAKECDLEKRKFIVSSHDYQWILGVFKDWRKCQDFLQRKYEEAKE